METDRAHSQTEGRVEPGPTETPVGALEQLITQQLGLMKAQLEMFGQGSAAPSSGVGVSTPSTVQHQTAAQQPPAEPTSALRKGAQIPSKQVSPDEASDTKPSHGPWKPLDKSRHNGLQAEQQRYIETLTQSLNARTPTSKELTQTHRAHLADPRTVAGFRSDWKELVYPIVVKGSEGAKFWDVDGNAYIDIAMGFGVNLFGHAPEFVMSAVKSQLNCGVEIGPQSPLAGETAHLICKLTDMERAAFCNTGSEAVLAAMRMARTVSGRDKIVTFAGDYHGLFDEVLARGIGPLEARRSVPIAPGIPRHMSQELLVLDYGDPASLDVIRAQADELAAVLVEPVQSRHPDLQPAEFLRELRQLTQDTDVALIFDEMITGFRTAPGGAQSYFGVNADIACYGKVLGGGFPIGVVAGRGKYMDALDGGMWRFGDDSVPEVGVTWFAGTFVRHPVALAASNAVLKHLAAEGPSLQQDLNARTSTFVNGLNQFYTDHTIPIYLEHFSSLFLITFQEGIDYASLFYRRLLDQGIHITEGRAAFFSTAHSEDDIEMVTKAMKQAALELREVNFI